MSATYMLSTGTCKYFHIFQRKDRYGKEHTLKYLREYENIHLLGYFSRKYSERLTQIAIEIL